MKLHKTVYVTLVFVLLAGLLSACGPAAPAQPAATEAPKAAEAQPTEAPQPAAGAEVVKLTYWHGWSVDMEKQAMEDAVKLFNDAHPNIQVEAISGKTNDQLLTAVSGGNPPDVAVEWSTQTLAQWASTGVVMDLTDLVKGAGIQESDFYPEAIACSKYNDKFYGLPIEIDGLLVYYNKDMFTAAGLDPNTPPKTMEEFLQYAEKLTKYDDQGNITQLGFAPGNFSEQVAYLYGGSWWNPTTGQPTANDPANVAAWTAMADYYKKIGADKIGTFNSQTADNPLGSLFLAGKVAMALDGDWVTNFMPRFAPTINWGLFAVPPPAGKEQYAYSMPVDGSIYVIPTGVQHPKESWEFVRWMATSKEASCLLQKGWANASPLKTVGADKACLPNEPYQTFLDAMAKGKMQIWPPINVSSMYNDEKNAARDRVNFGQQEVKAALDELQAKIEDEMKKAANQ